MGYSRHFIHSGGSGRGGRVSVWRNQHRRRPFFHFSPANLTGCKLLLSVRSRRGCRNCRQRRRRGRNRSHHRRLHTCFIRKLCFQGGRSRRFFKYQHNRLGHHSRVGRFGRSCGGRVGKSLVGAASYPPLRAGAATTTGTAGRGGDGVTFLAPVLMDSCHAAARQASASSTGTPGNGGNGGLWFCGRQRQQRFYIS